MLNRIKSILLAVWADVCDTYGRIKIYLLALGAIIAIFEWRKLKAAILVKMGQQELNSANKQDKVFAANEQSDEAKADALVKKASEETAKDDWYKSE
jgi:hypothetical protein